MTRLISLRAAGRHFKERKIANASNPLYLRGVADAIGISFVEVPPSLGMTEEDFKRLCDRVEQINASYALTA